MEPEKIWKESAQSRRAGEHHSAAIEMSPVFRRAASMATAELGRGQEGRSRLEMSQKFPQAKARSLIPRSFWKIFNDGKDKELNLTGM